MRGRYCALLHIDNIILTVRLVESFEKVQFMRRRFGTRMRIDYIVLTDAQAGGEVLKGSVNAR